MDKYETEIPWAEVKNWVSGEWYPMPVGFFARNQKEYIIEGYMIFRRDDEHNPDDMVPVRQTDRCFTFSTALKICEEHNGRTMIE